MSKILENKKLLLVVAFIVVVLVLYGIMITKRGKSVGYVTIDINNESIVLGYNKNNKINKVKGIKDSKDLKNKDVLEALDKVLSNYKDGTVILIGRENTEIGKKVDKYFIDDYFGIDRHIIKFIYLDKDSTGKETLLKALGLDMKDKSIKEIVDYARENSLDLNKYAKDLDELDGYHSRD